MMKFCSVCGHENKIQYQFCQQCGAPFASHNDPTPAPQATSTKERSPKKMTRLSKIVLALLTLLIVVAVGAHLWIKQAIDPYKQLTATDRAFIAKDYEGFLAYFTLPEKTIQNAESFYTFMKEQDWSNTISPLIKEKIKEVENGIYSDPIYDEKNNQLIRVIDEPYLGIYKKIIINLEPVTVEARTTMDELTVEFAENTISMTKDDKEVLGLFTPGTHTFDLTLTDDISTETYEQTKTIIGGGKNEKDVTFDFQDQTIRVTSDYEDAFIYVDGVNTQKTAKNIRLYTIPLDHSVTLQAVLTVDNVEKKSEAVTVGDTQIHLAFADVQAKKIAEQAATEKKEATERFVAEYDDSARQLFYNFRSDYYNAISYGNFSYVADYFANGSQVKEDYRKFIVGHNDFEFSYTYDFISNDVVSVEAVSVDTLNVYSYEIFEFFTSLEENWHYERQKKYTLKLINGTLRIINLDDSADVKKTPI